MKKNIYNSKFLTNSILFLLFSISPMITSKAFSEENGATLYKLYCSQCHGLKGNGVGINASDLKVNPQNHTDMNYMATKTDEQLETVIKIGGIGVSKSPIMPGWGDTLTSKQIKLLVRHLRKLCKCEYSSVISHKKLKTVDINFKD